MPGGTSGPTTAPGQSSETTAPASDTRKTGGSRRPAGRSVTHYVGVLLAIKYPRHDLLADRGIRRDVPRAGRHARRMESVLLRCVNLCHDGHADLWPEGEPHWGGHPKLVRRRRRARVTASLHSPLQAVRWSPGPNRLAQRTRRLIRRQKQCPLGHQRNQRRPGPRGKSSGMVPGSRLACLPPRVSRRQSASGAPASWPHRVGARAGCVGWPAQLSR
jgi:hypothetical protein